MKTSIFEVFAEAIDAPATPQHHRCRSAREMQEGCAYHQLRARRAVQLLFSTGKSFTVDGLREKLREFFRQEVFRARLRVAGVDLDEFDGRWVVGRGLVVAAISVSRYQGPRTPTLGGAA